jgi:NAD+ synthase (glutamine-hydrolysing)
MMKITIAQLNPVIGDIKGNFSKLQQVVSDFADKTDLIIFPELYLTGYPPRDILENPAFIRSVEQTLSDIVELSNNYPEVGILTGTPVSCKKEKKVVLYNSAVLISAGKILGQQHKTLLPAYDVFDETRYFEPSLRSNVISFKRQKLGISICEDMWTKNDMKSRKYYSKDPLKDLVDNGATILINLSASPFFYGKEELRYDLISNHARQYGIPFIFVNQVGGNDELIFDGRSLCVDGRGKPVSVLPPFQQIVQNIDLGRRGEENYVPQEPIESVYNALVLGIRDYMAKSGFSKSVIGLSGGIDSAVTCAIAREAMGYGDIIGVNMPSPYSASESEEYSKLLADNLGIELLVIPITEVYQQYLRTLSDARLIDDPDNVNVTLQNIQARIRGGILMAFSNEQERLLLSTGNKSEMAVGYCTLYGDMAGGLAVISDIPKTMVYKLADYINRETEIIPQQIIERQPSAELSPGQIDSHALPPYEILDRILFYYIEENFSAKQISDLGFDISIVKWIIRSVNRNEYKRRQAPPGLKVTSKAFGAGRRMPISAVYDF